MQNTGLFKFGAPLCVLSNRLDDQIWLKITTLYQVAELSFPQNSKIHFDCAVLSSPLFNVLNISISIKGSSPDLPGHPGAVAQAGLACLVRENYII